MTVQGSEHRVGRPRPARALPSRPMRRTGTGPSRLFAVRAVVERRWVAPLLDLLCLILFVGIGRESHGITTGVNWFLEVLWPLAVGWFAVALAAGLYLRPRHTWLRWLLTVGFGILVAILLRPLTQRDSFTVYTIVAYLFVGLTTLLWRGVAAGAVVMARRRRSPAV